MGDLVGRREAADRGLDPLDQFVVVACQASGIAPPEPVGFLGGCNPLVRLQRIGTRGVVLGPGSVDQARQLQHRHPLPRQLHLRGIVHHTKLRMRHVCPSFIRQSGAPRNVRQEG